METRRLESSFPSTSIANTILPLRMACTQILQFLVLIVVWEPGRMWTRTATKKTPMKEKRSEWSGWIRIFLWMEEGTGEWCGIRDTSQRKCRLSSDSFWKMIQEVGCRIVPKTSYIILMSMICSFGDFGSFFWKRLLVVVMNLIIESSIIAWSSSTVSEQPGRKDIISVYSFFLYLLTRAQGDQEFENCWPNYKITTFEHDDLCFLCITHLVPCHPLSWQTSSLQPLNTFSTPSVKCEKVQLLVHSQTRLTSGKHSQNTLTNSILTLITFITPISTIPMTSFVSSFKTTPLPPFRMIS